MSVEEQPQIKEHPEDILVVCNVDVACNAIDTTEGWRHSEFFRVKWGGHPFEVPPGKTRKMPRYVAEHYAKHLADHMLMKMEDETHRQGLVMSPVERPKMIAQIIVGVDTYYGQYGEPTLDDAGKAAELVDTFNQPEVESTPMNAGLVPNRAMGKLIPEPIPAEEIVSNMPDEPQPEGKTSIWDTNLPLPTHKQLLEECKKLDIEVRGNESKESLAQKLRDFAGK